MPVKHLNAGRKLKHLGKSLPPEIHKFKPINLLFLLHRTPVAALSPLLPKLRYVTKDRMFWKEGADKNISTRVKITGDWRKFHNEELHNRTLRRNTACFIAEMSVTKGGYQSLCSNAEAMSRFSPQLDISIITDIKSLYLTFRFHWLRGFFYYMGECYFS
jgi:hypothetical protein